MVYNDRMTLLARTGFAARGLVYILIGWFALDVAVNGGKLIDNEGALGTLSTAPMGRVLIAICAIGFLGYAFWRLTEAITDPERRARDFKGRIERTGYAMSGITHIFLATAAARLALQQRPVHDGSPGDENAQGWSAWLLEQPGGSFLLILAGLVLFAIAAAQALKAYKAEFQELNGTVPVPHYVRWIGRSGYAARALIFALIGWFLVSAASNRDAARAGGLGEALEQLREQDEGAALLGVVAIGLFLFGIFSLVEARYRRINVTKPHFLK